MLKTSQNGIDLITHFEGCMLKSYKPLPTEKFWTIGYGHNGSDVSQNETITKTQAIALLKQDIKRFEDTINQFVKTSLNQNQFDALISFVFNVGSGAFEHSDLLVLINRGDFQNASLEFAKWCHTGKQILVGLQRRREAERELFVKPVPVVISKPKITTVVYTVKDGDSLSKIATLYKTTVQKIAKDNHIQNVNLVKAGQKITIIK